MADAFGQSVATYLANVEKSSKKKSSFQFSSRGTRRSTSTESLTGGGARKLRGDTFNVFDNNALELYMSKQPNAAQIEQDRILAKFLTDSSQ